MKKTFLIFAICVSVVSLMLGGAVFSFASVKNRIEAIEDTSSNILYDLSSVSLFAFTAKDFFEGATEFELQLIGWGEDGETPNGAYAIIYRSFRDADIEGYRETIREEEFPISTKENPLTADEAETVLKRVRYPLKPFLDWERSEYDGAFSGVINAIQYIAYIFGMIWGALSLVMLVAIDTISTAWELLRVALTSIGLA